MGRSVRRRDVLAGAVASAAALCAGAAATASPTTHEVRISGFAFIPARLEVQPGDTIRWINDDLAPHTATADDFGWDTGEIVQNQSAEITVTTEMETSYFCVFHPHMMGELIIG